MDPSRTNMHGWLLFQMAVLYILSFAMESSTDPTGDNATLSSSPMLLHLPAGSSIIGTSDTTPMGGGLALEGRTFGDFDEHPQQSGVMIDSFFIATTEVTNAQYEEFDPWHKMLRGFEHGYSVGDDEAVVFVSHLNATQYCEWLTNNQQPLLPQKQRFQYRLPTELEWERAARAGTTTNFWWGDAFDQSKAHPPGHACPTACPNLTVAQFSSNTFGLFDTVGNVEEWTSSPYAPYVPHNHTPTWSDYTLGLVVARGGSHSDDMTAYYMRSANRAATVPDERSSTIGFRVAATLIQQGATNTAHTITPSEASKPHSRLADSNHTATDNHVNRRAPVGIKSSSPSPSPSLTPRVPTTTTTVSQSAPSETPQFFGPFEYVQFSSDITIDSGGPIFLQHNHAPGLGVLPDNKTLIVGWFSTITEAGREPAYAFSTMNVGAMVGAMGSSNTPATNSSSPTTNNNTSSTSNTASTSNASPTSNTANYTWANASLFWKAADRGAQTQLFYTDPTTQLLSWYAAMSPQAGYIDASIVRRDLVQQQQQQQQQQQHGGWSNATIVTHTRVVPGVRAHQHNHASVPSIYASNTSAPLLPLEANENDNDSSQTIPLHADGHIPFERIIPVTINGTSALAMPATYLAVVPNKCVGCPGSVSSVVLTSTDEGNEWTRSGGYMSGISQFVVLNNGSWLALGRGGGGYPATPTSTVPALTRSISHDEGEHWDHGFYEGLWPLGVGVRHVFFRLQEGPLLLISFTWGSNVTTISGKVRRFTGLYAATSIDEGLTFQIKKPIVNEASPPAHLPSMDKIPWTMTNSTAEPRGYTSARQTPDGMIHVVTSRLSYHFNLDWLNRAPPDAPDAPLPGPSPAPPGPLGPPIPNGTWFTLHADWEMHSPTAHRTIRAIRDTQIRSTMSSPFTLRAPSTLEASRDRTGSRNQEGGDQQVIDVKAGWSFVLLKPPQLVGAKQDTWQLECTCPRI